MHTTMGRATRCRVWLATASTTIVLLALAAVAFGASPVGGATYRGTAHQKFVKADENHESFTISKNGKRIVKWRFWTTGSCNWGRRYDLFDDNTGETPIAIANGRFNTTHTVSGSVGSKHGTITIHYQGRFTNARTAPATVTIDFEQGGAGQPVGGSCSTKATFTAKTAPSLGRGGGVGG